MEIRRARTRRLGALLASALCFATSAALAQDATWNGATADWKTPANWAPPTAVPAATATFSSTGSTNVQNTSAVTIGAIDFTATPNAQGYAFLVGSAFTINAAGVTNASTSAQFFEVLDTVTMSFQNGATANNGTGVVDYTVDEGGTASFANNSNAGNSSTGWTNNGTITFANTASGGAATFSNFGNNASIVFNDSSTAGTTATYTSINAATITFNNTSSAGSASFTQNGTSTLTFNNASSAATATITNNTGTVAFNDTSTAGSATITNSHSLQFNTSATAGSATITNAQTTDFNNGSNAGSAHITNQLTGVIVFNATSSASTATITNGGNLDFEGTSTAGSATITTTGPAGFTAFAAASTGGSARLITNPGGIVDISNLTTAGMTAGSIEGSGDFFLGSKQLTVGSNGRSTTVDGLISDGGTGGGIGGSLDKVGTGTLTLTGTDTYSGATTIDGGTLTVNGSIASSSGVTINSGSTLNGTGTVPAVTVNSGGILMPGPANGVGTLTGTGHVTFNSGASYQIFITGTANSKFTTSGSAAINPNVAVGVLSGSTITVGNRYTIFTATGGLTGQFNPTVDYSFYVGTVAEDGNNAYLTFRPNSLGLLLGPNPPTNPLNVATALTSVLNSTGTLPAGFQGLFTQTPALLANSLEQLDGEAATGAQLAGFQAMNNLLGLMLSPLSGSLGSGLQGLSGNLPTGPGPLSGPLSAPLGPLLGNNAGNEFENELQNLLGPLPFAPSDGPHATTPDVASAYASALKARPAPVYGRWQAWGSAYGGTQSLSGAPATVGSHDVTSRAAGFAAGLTYRASADTAYGFALAGAETGWDLAAGFGSGHSDAFQAGVYGTHQIGRAYVSGALAFANYWASTTRVVTVAGTDTLTASFDAQSFATRFEGGYRIDLRPVVVTPYAALQAQSFHTPNYGETAASGSPQFALNYAAQTSSAERAEVGSWIGRNFQLANRDSIMLFGRAAYAHDWFTNLAATPTFQALPGASFAVNGATPAPDLALVTAGAEWRMAHNWSLMARFDGEFGSGDQTYTGTARLRYAW